MSRWRAFGRAPLIRFLALGGLLLLAEAELWPLLEGPPSLLVTASRIEALADEHQRRHGRLPEAAELDALVSAWIDEELALREARRLGLEQGDLVVRRRLVEQITLLEEGPHDATNEARPAQADARFERALKLGLDRTDPIVRRRLIQRLDEHWAEQEGSLRPSEEALRAHLEQHREQFLVPERIRVSHLFFAGSHSLSRAEEELERLPSDPTYWQPDLGPERGDTFVLGSTWPPRTREKLERTLGPAATELAFSAPQRIWVGPVESAWGHHLIFVRERQPAELPPIDQIRPQLLRSLAEARTAERRRYQRQRLRNGHRIEVEGTAVAGAAVEGEGPSTGDTGP